MPSSHKTHLFLSICLFIIFVFSTANLLKVFLLPGFPDFTEYYYATYAFAHGVNPYLYNKHYFPFPYPPAALLFFLPFTWLSLFVAGKLFLILSFLCLLLSVYFMLRLFHVSVRSLLGIFLMIFIFNFFPTKFTLANGQINMVILLFVVLFVYWYKNKRSYLSGGILACAIALKLFPALLIPYLIIQKQWRILTSMIITMFFIAIIVFLAMHSTIYGSYLFKTLPAMFKTGGGMYYYDQSLSSFIARILQNPSSIEIARVLAGVLIISTFYLLWLYRKFTDVELMGINIIIILNLILNNFAWQHHFVWLLVPFVVTFFYIYNKQINRRCYVLLGLSYLLVAFNFKTPSTIPTLLQSHVLYGAILLYALDMYLLSFHAGKPMRKKRIKAEIK